MTIQISRRYTTIKLFGFVYKAKRTWGGTTTYRSLTRG